MIKNSLALVLLALCLVGCATEGVRNPLAGRNDEFAQRIVSATALAQFAPSPERDLFDSQRLTCQQYQRAYFDYLNAARTGDLTPMLLRSFEFQYDQELKILEKQAQRLATAE